MQALLVGGGLSTRNSSISGEKRSRTTRKVTSISSWSSEGALADSKRALHLAPEPAQELDVGRQLLVRLALRDGAHDESARRRRELLDDGAEAVALGVVVDAARHADVAGLRHVDDVAARDGHEGGDARALGAERLLGDLDQDLLALAQHLLDGRDRLARRGGSALGLRLASLSPSSTSARPLPRRGGRGMIRRPESAV